MDTDTDGDSDTDTDIETNMDMDGELVNFYPYSSVEPYELPRTY
jgi:hypothetical protein